MVKMEEWLCQEICIFVAPQVQGSNYDIAGYVFGIFRPMKCWEHCEEKYYVKPLTFLLSPSSQKRLILKKK